MSPNLARHPLPGLTLMLSAIEKLAENGSVDRAENPKVDRARMSIHALSGRAAFEEALATEASRSLKDGQSSTKSRGEIPAGQGI